MVIFFLKSPNFVPRIKLTHFHQQSAITEAIEMLEFPEQDPFV